MADLAWGMMATPSAAECIAQRLLWMGRSRRFLRRVSKWLCCIMSCVQAHPLGNWSVKFGPLQATQSEDGRWLGLGQSWAHGRDR